MTAAALLAAGGIGLGVLAWLELKLGLVSRFRGRREAGIPLVVPPGLRRPGADEPARWPRPSPSTAAPEATARAGAAGQPFRTGADAAAAQDRTGLETEYEIVRELGRGRSTVVYLARERELGRQVAIKLFRPEYAADGEAAARLAREAQALGALQHPGIAVLYGTRRLRSGNLALLLQYVPGRTLREVLAAGPIPASRARAILTDVARALAFMHRQGLVHLDLKPENIHIDEETGVARLTDLGSARPWGSHVEPAVPGVGGSASVYMSPEQLGGGVVDGRSDVYSLGLLGHEMLTGVRPHGGAAGGASHRHAAAAGPAPLPVRADVPAPLRRALEGAVAVAREQRWQDVGQFLSVMDARSSTPGPVSGEEPAAGPAVAPTARREPAASMRWTSYTAQPPGRRWLAAGIVLLALLGTAVYAGTYPWARDAGERQESADGSISVRGADAQPVAAGTGASAGAHAALAYALLGAVQQGTAGDTLPHPLTLRVEDATGGPVIDARVRFDVVKGSGMLLPAEAITDSSGVAAAWFVPDAAGRHDIHASAGDVAIVRFTADVSPPGPAGGRVPGPVRPGETGQSGSGVSGAPPASPAAPAAPAPTLPVPTGAAPPRGTLGLAAGGTHTCAVDGATLLCWGGNDSGQIGDGTTTRRLGPAAVTLPEQPVALSAGVAHSCMVGGSGAAWCWGGNASGQLGDGTTTARPAPTRVAGGLTFTSVAAGAAHSCALTAAGVLYCWGRNGHGQLGDGTRSDRVQPVRVNGLRPVRSVTVGWSHTCALDSDGTAWCWGRNDAGQLGDGGTTDRAMPVPVAGAPRLAALTAGSRHTCGIDPDGVVMCWGGNAEGQLGTGVLDGAVAPVPVRSPERFTAVAAGAVHTCGLARDGRPWCWGGNPYGQLGDGSTEGRAVPVQVTGGRRFTALTASGAHSCAGQAGGAWFCWGYNVEGQLGDGSTRSRSRPTAVGPR